MSLLRYTKYGLYCPAGDFYIDASGRVERNVVTHAHSDHARPGHKSYLAHVHSLPFLKGRLGKKTNVQSLEYGKKISLNGVTVSLHPAGHIYGSSQIRVSHASETWVISGDYKLEDDRLATPFEPVKCDVFVTECTFGLPVYHWPNQDDTYEAINSWWRKNKSGGITSLLYGYSLGKSQRIIKNIDHSIGKVFVHKTVGNMNDAIRSTGAILAETTAIHQNTTSEDLKGNLIIAPPSFAIGRMFHGIGPVSTAMASGWAQSGKNFSRGGVDRGFILSDHADWDGLLQAIDATGAEKIVTMHGYTMELSRYLNENGIDSVEIDNLKNSPYKL